MAQKTVKRNDGDSSYAPQKAIIEQFNALLAKLDADVGVTDVDYAATLTINTTDG